MNIDGLKGIPANRFLSTTVVRENADEFGLLSEQEVEWVVGYLSHADILTGTIRTNREIDAVRILADAHEYRHHGQVSQEDSNGDFSSRLEQLFPDNMGGIIAGDVLYSKFYHDKLLLHWHGEFGGAASDFETYGIHVPDPESFVDVGVEERFIDASR